MMSAITSGYLRMNGPTDLPQVMFSRRALPQVMFSRRALPVSDCSFHNRLHSIIGLHPGVCEMGCLCDFEDQMNLNTIIMWHPFSCGRASVIGSIPHGGPIDLFLFQLVLHNWYNKGHGMCYPVIGIMHTKEPLLLIGKSSPCSGGSRFPSHCLSGFFYHMFSAI